MTRKSLRVFLDTSVIFAAVLSTSGGARKLFLLGEAGFLHLVVGPNVLRECQEVILRKSPPSLPILAQLLSMGRVETSDAPSPRQIELARTLVDYSPDAHVLAEAMNASPDWFVTHDKEHFLKKRPKTDPPFIIGTPGDLLQALKDDLTPR
jgi:predicted nucleic acid-binding protein